MSNEIDWEELLDWVENWYLYATLENPLEKKLQKKEKRAYDQIVALIKSDNE